MSKVANHGRVPPPVHDAVDVGRHEPLEQGPSPGVDGVQVLEEEGGDVHGAIPSRCASPGV